MFRAGARTIDLSWLRNTKVQKTKCREPAVEYTSNSRTRWVFRDSRVVQARSL